ncbi:MAG: hypothetical protein WCX46_01550 [Candidatus Paceibacterota bacterium]
MKTLTLSELLMLLHNKTAYLKTYFVSFKKIKDGKDEILESQCKHKVYSVENVDPYFDISFLEDQKPKDFFKKHKQNISKNKNCKIIAHSLKWDQTKLFTVTYDCICISINEERWSFKIKVNDAFFKF